MDRFLDLLNSCFQNFMQLLFGWVRTPLNAASPAASNPHFTHLLFPGLPSWQDLALSSGLLCVLFAVMCILWFLEWGAMVTLMAAAFGWFYQSDPAMVRLRRARKWAGYFGLVVVITCGAILAVGIFLGYACYMLVLLVNAISGPDPSARFQFAISFVIGLVVACGVIAWVQGLIDKYLPPVTRSEETLPGVGAVVFLHKKP